MTCIVSLCPRGPAPAAAQRLELRVPGQDRYSARRHKSPRGLAAGPPRFRTHYGANHYRNSCHRLHQAGSSRPPGAWFLADLATIAGRPKGRAVNRARRSMLIQDPVNCTAQDIGNLVNSSARPGPDHWCHRRMDFDAHAAAAVKPRGPRSEKALGQRALRATPFEPLGQKNAPPASPLNRRVKNFCPKT